MQNSSGSTNLLILVVKVLGLKGNSLQMQQKGKTALLAPIISVSTSPERGRVKGEGGRFHSQPDINENKWYQTKRRTEDREAYSPPGKTINEHTPLVSGKWLMNTLLISLHLASHEPHI